MLATMVLFAYAGTSTHKCILIADYTGLCEVPCVQIK